MREKILTMPKIFVVVIGTLIMAGFLAVMNVASLVFVRFLPQQGYVLQMAGELAAAVYCVVVLALLHYLGILKDKGEGFLKGFYTGGFMLAYCGYVLVAQLYLIVISGTGEVQSVGWILTYAFTMFLVGFNEELVMRGAVLHLFLDRFGGTKKAVLTSVILSSAIFGAAHLCNILSGVSVESAVVQALQATLLGVLFAAIYLRSGNIWITITAHALTDFAALSASGIFGEGDIVDGINSISWLNLAVTVPLFLIPAVILLRPAKLEEIVLRRRGQAVIPTEKEVDNMAAVSLALGIIGTVTGCVGYGVGVSLAGLLGAVISRKYKKEGNGMALAGMILSVIGLVLGIVMGIAMLFVLPSIDYLSL